jgi:hypothetical protein
MLISTGAIDQSVISTEAIDQSEISSVADSPIPLFCASPVM